LYFFFFLENNNKNYGSADGVTSVLFGGATPGLAEREDAVVVAADRTCGGINLEVNSGEDMTISSDVNWNRSDMSGDLSGMVVVGSLN
jgi:hypothetical protein